MHPPVPLILIFYSAFPFPLIYQIFAFNFYQHTIVVLTILIPVFNEAATVETVLNAVLHAPLPAGTGKQIIIINDCSTDETPAIVQRFISQHPQQDIQLINHPVNKGKGAALHSGIAKATGDYTIIQDADLEYDPAEYTKLLAPVLKGYADIVYGSRFVGSDAHRVLFFHHYMANRLITFLSNLFTNLNLTDIETCYKLFNTRMLQSVRLREKRFGFEPEVTARIARIPGVRIYEVGISYYGRTYKEGKKIGFKDGLKALWCILKYNTWSRR
jgi:glycosyltransferase involved in cell wall biosynthesis